MDALYPQRNFASVIVNQPSIENTMRRTAYFKELPEITKLSSPRIAEPKPYVK